MSAMEWVVDICSIPLGLVVLIMLCWLLVNFVLEGSIKSSDGTAGRGSNDNLSSTSSDNYDNWEQNKRADALMEMAAQRIEREEREARAEDVRSYRYRNYTDEEIREKFESKWGYQNTKDAFQDADFKNGCFIATASLQGHIPQEALEPLKTWRYSVLEKSKAGSILSSFYRKDAPAVAEKVEGQPIVSGLLRSLFVRPALVLVDKKQTFVRDFFMWTLFITGMVTAKLLTLFKK